MELSQWLIVLFCVVGAGITSYKIGVTRGVEHTVDFLVEEGILELDEEED